MSVALLTEVTSELRRLGAGALLCVVALAAPAGAATGVEAPPVVLAGDELLVDVPGQPESGGVLDVDVYGYVTIEPSPPTLVAGRDVQEAAGVLAAAMRDFYRDTDGLTIRILRRRLAVLVEGRVAAPGAYLLPHNGNIEDALRLAGGVTEGGLTTRVILDRAGDFREFDLREYRITGRRELMPALETGDRIFVPVSNREAPIKASLAPITVPFEDPNVVHVMGVVGRGGTHQMPGELSIFEALALGGGPVAGADRRRGRVLPPGGHGYMLDLDALAAGHADALPTVSAGTTIIVPEQRDSFFKETLLVVIPVILATAVVQVMN